MALQNFRILHRFVHKHTVDAPLHNLQVKLSVYSTVWKILLFWGGSLGVILTCFKKFNLFHWKTNQNALSDFKTCWLSHSPIVLDIPGSDLKNVCILRSPEDANYIAEQGKGKNVVIIGTSFIGKQLIFAPSCLKSHQWSMTHVLLEIFVLAHKISSLLFQPPPKYMGTRAFQVCISWTLEFTPQW